MATTMNVPWLICDLYDQQKMGVARRMAPAEGFALTVFSRHGVPLFSAESPNKEATLKVFGDLSAMLELMKPENPKGWADRTYYVSAIQLAKHAKDRGEPVLVGNPIVPDALKQRKVYAFEAQMQVKADGSVGDVQVTPDPAISEKMSAAISSALKKAAMVPAVENGKFVDGSYTYRFRTEP